MSKARYSFLVAVVVCLAVLMPGVATAGVHIGIGFGFGTVIGPHHHYGHGWYGGWYGWPHYRWCDPWYDPWPVIVAPPIIVAPPVVRERVIVREHKPPAPPKEDETTILISEQQQQKRSESLKKLKIGDVASRIQAVLELEPFAGDNKVRTDLEKALLSDRDAQVRKTVAELFGRVRDSRTLPALKQARANDFDRDVRQAAYKAIIMMEGY